MWLFLLEHHFAEFAFLDADKQIMSLSMRDYHFLGKYLIACFSEEPTKHETVIKQEVKQEKADDKSNSIKPPPEKRAKLARWHAHWLVVSWDQQGLLGELQWISDREWE